MTTWADVLPEHQANVSNYQGSGHGFREGPGNQNPWTEELGIGDLAYCAAGATRVPAHHGVAWPSDAQFGARGIAYSPSVRECAARHGWWAYDHASQGRPCDLQPGDVVTYDWNGDGVEDHTGTVLAVYADDTFDAVEYNTGSPGGCYVVRRNRKYLSGRWRMVGSLYALPPAPQPTPTPIPGAQSMADFFPYDGRFMGGVNIDAADIDGDGQMEIVCGPGPGGGPDVEVWRIHTDGSVAKLGGFMAYDTAFVGGISVSAGKGVIVTGAGPGGGPHVRVFDFWNVLGLPHP